MKNFQQNLLVILAICLCALCAYQWYGQTHERNAIQQLNQMVYDQSVNIRDYTNSIATLNHQVLQLDTSVTDLRNTARTNDEKIAAQGRQLEELQVTNEVLTNEIGQYQDAVGTLTNRLADAYAGIEKQNVALKELAAQRDQFVQKFNDEVKDRNNIVSNYNALATEVKKMESKQ
jgi:predicted RNase H-like nuclease (RuvC/YqgF family)